jgi:hypothetical protein
LHREYTRAPRGEIIEDSKRGQKFERANAVGALCNGARFGIECYRRMADSVFFEKRFEGSLLGELPKGYTVIIDNARFHRKKELRRLARWKARLLFLPPCSPDYNSIEKAWANMKRFLCNNLKDFHSVDSGIHDYFECIDI